MNGAALLLRPWGKAGVVIVGLIAVVFSVVVGTVALKGSGPTMLPPLEDYVPTRAHLDLHEEHVRQVAENYGIGSELESITYDISAWRDPSGVGPAIEACMAEQGFRVESDGSSYSWILGPDEELSHEFKVALVRCEGENPVRGDLGAPFSMGERWYFSGLLRNELQPCLARSGFDKFKVPPRLILTYVIGETYDPGAQLRSKYPDASEDAINSAIVSCQTLLSDVRVLDQ